MASVRCDVFRHRRAKNPTYLIANIGVMRGHLQANDWEHVLANVVTPLFAKKDIDRRGWHLARYSKEFSERAKRWYGKDKVSKIDTA
jgi:hypothetical protein